MAIVPSLTFAGSSHGGIVEKHVQCAQRPMYFGEFAALSGSSRLHCSVNFGSGN